MKPVRSISDVHSLPKRVHREAKGQWDSEWLRHLVLNPQVFLLPARCNWCGVCFSLLAFGMANFNDCP